MSDLNNPTPVEPNDDDGSVHPRLVAIGLICVVIIIFAVTCGLAYISNEPVAVAPPPPPAPPIALFEEYVVKDNDFLIKIAEQHGESLEQLIEDNADVLTENAKDCFRLDDDYVAGIKKVQKRGKTVTVPRPGYYCNASLTLQGQPMLGPNSIKPGLRLKVRLLPTATFAGNPTL